MDINLISKLWVAAWGLFIFKWVSCPQDKSKQLTNHNHPNNPTSAICILWNWFPTWMKTGASVECMTMSQTLLFSKSKCRLCLSSPIGSDRHNWPWTLQNGHLIVRWRCVSSSCDKMCGKTACAIHWMEKAQSRCMMESQENHSNLCPMHGIVWSCEPILMHTLLWYIHVVSQKKSTSDQAMVKGVSRRLAPGAHCMTS